MPLPPGRRVVPFKPPGGSPTVDRGATGDRRASDASPAVLIVDDESLFRQSVVEALKAAQPTYRVYEAEHGREALTIVTSRRIDVLVTDLRMPVMDGLELILALPDTRFRGQIVVVTAFGSPRVETEVVSHGAIAYLEKPVDLHKLIELVRCSVEGERSHIEGLTLSGITQLLAVERKTCLLRVTKGSMSGELTFQDGELVDAHLGDLEGNEAALALLAWDEGTSLDVLAGVGLQDPKITEGLTHLMLEAMRLRDEAGADHGAGSRGDSAAHPPKETVMSTVSESLGQIMEIEGAIGVALVDHESGMSLGQAGGGELLNLDVAGAGNTAVVRAKLRVMDDLGLDDGIEDILITLGTQYHLIRPLRSAPNLFLYLALKRQRANLAMARHRLSSIEKTLIV